MTYRYKAYQLSNIDKNPELQSHVPQAEIEEMKVVAHVLPHKVNNYYNQEIIDWENYQFDPGFRLVYPQRDMLPPALFEIVKEYLETFSDKEERKIFLNSIRLKLNPHPAGQKTHNVPIMDGLELHSLQHKYAETLLIFPYHAHTCAAYCQMCFRWPLFVDDEAMKFTVGKKINIQMEVALEYIRRHPEITNALITGGDPMVMAPKLLRQYIRPLFEANIPHLQAIRIGSKQLSYQPYTFTQGKKAQQILQLFQEVTDAGIHLSFMAHFSHKRELETESVQEAIKNILSTGANMRTQSPVLRFVNDKWQEWAGMWKKQTTMGMIPYYFFVVRDTGAQDYFAVSLERAWNIFRDAYSRVSGLARTVRGPSMSCIPGKVEITGISKIFGVKLFNLRFLQGRNPEWVGHPFYAKYDPKAIWMDDLQPVIGNKFFFEEEMPIFDKAIGSEMIPLELMPTKNEPVPQIPVQMLQG